MKMSATRLYEVRPINLIKVPFTDLSPSPLITPSPYSSISLSLSQTIFISMAAQRTEKEETEFKPETPLSLSTPSVTVPPPPRKFRYAVSPSRLQIKTLPETVEVTEEVPVREKREVRRCVGCRKKVGLTGFRCRCGDLFCSEHRYSDRHVCGYDYKAAGREAIAKENPLVKAAKIIRL